MERGGIIYVYVGDDEYLQGIHYNRQEDIGENTKYGSLHYIDNMSFSRDDSIDDYPQKANHTYVYRYRVREGVNSNCNVTNNQNSLHLYYYSFVLCSSLFYFDLD